MFEISKHSDNIRNTVTGIVFPQDETNTNYPAYLDWLKLENTPIEVDFFEGEQNEKLTDELTKEVMQTVNYLTLRALSSSIGKKGTRLELEAMKAIYNEKYNVASGITVNLNMVQTITDEMNRDYPTTEDLDSVLVSYGITPTGTKLERFYQFIIFRFETGLSYYQFFISLVEDFRTCALTHIEKLDFNKCRIVIDMAKSIPENITQPELVEMRTEMLGI